MVVVRIIGRGRVGILAAARSHKFSQLADAIDTAFARWDRSHLYKFEMADGPLIGRSSSMILTWDSSTAPRRGCRRCRWVSSSSTR